MAVTTVIFGLVCGALIDRYSAVRILPFFLFPLFIAILVAALVTPVWGIYLFMLLFGVSYGFTSTLLGALWPEIYGTAHLGGIRAITVSGMVLATAVGPGLTGTLIDAGVALPTQLLWMAGWCVIASGVLFFVSHQLLTALEQGALDGNEVPFSRNVFPIGFSRNCPVQMEKRDSLWPSDRPPAGGRSCWQTA